MAQVKTGLYSKKKRIYAAVDCIIFCFDSGKLKLLLSKRRVGSLKEQWSLIGSYVLEEENWTDAAQRVVKEFTGLVSVFLEQLKIYGKAERDPRFQCLSIAHYVLIRLNDSDEKRMEKNNAYWFNIDEVPDLGFDHNQMVQDAFERLKQKARFRPICFKLLPEKFTLLQLQQLYEELYQKKLDRGNFRRKILSLNVLTKLDEKDKTTSKKGAFLYELNDKKYYDLKKAGYSFEIF